MLEEPDGAHAEAFRLLRTNVEFAMMDRPANVFLVTSAIAAEGKSYDEREPRGRVRPGGPSSCAR